MWNHFSQHSFSPALASALTTFSLVAGTLGPRALDADGDDATQAEKAQIAAATPDTVSAHARIAKDPASPSGWSAYLSAENPSDEAIGIDTELAISETVGGEMSRSGPRPSVKFEQKIHLDLVAHGKVEFKVAVPKGKLTVTADKLARSAFASVYVVKVIKADGTVIAAAPRYPTMARRMPIIREPLLLDEPAAPVVARQNAAPEVVPPPPQAAQAK